VYVSHVVGVGGGGRGLELMGTATGAAVDVVFGAKRRRVLLATKTVGQEPSVCAHFDQE
jgi:hypothetical protein